MIAAMSLIRCFNGLGNGHACIYPVSNKAILESEFLGPLGNRFCFSHVFHRSIALPVSILCFASCPSNVSGVVSGIVINSIYAEFSLRFRAWTKSGCHIVTKWDEFFPFFAHPYAAFKVSIGLLVIGLASPVHLNPPRIEVRSFFRVFVFPVLSESGAGAFNLPTSTTLNRLEVMPLVVRGFAALTKALPDGVSLIIKTMKSYHREAMEFLPKVAFDMRGYFHSPIKCGLPQIVNIYA